MADTKKNATRQQVSGILGVVIGMAIGFWARSHSPHMGFMEMVAKAERGGWALKEPYYYGAMIIAAVFVLAGIITIVQSFLPARKD